MGYASNAASLAYLKTAEHRSREIADAIGRRIDACWNNKRMQNTIGNKNRTGKKKNGWRSGQRVEGPARRPLASAHLSSVATTHARFRSSL